METKTEKLGLSGSELVAYVKQFKDGEEFATQHTEDIKAFVQDVETLYDSMGNLYEASKVPLALGGIEVKVEVTAMGHPLFQAQLGEDASQDKLVDMIKKIVEN